MSRSTWSETQLYQTLNKRKGNYKDSIANLLQRPHVMAAIETILDLGGTTPKDFTLHDSEHSFRVAQRMWEIIPLDTREILSDYELGLLLLSAYLHDIGMSPEYQKVQRHRDFLTTTGDRSLSAREIADFQQWIDDDHRTRNLDIGMDKPTDAKLVNYILSYYVRYKHNQWSGDWIRENLAGESLKNYPQWLDDLVLICQSHHYGQDHLEQERFEPRLVDPGIVVHRRFLSMCLRVADVMENDPERTPDVLLNHRQIGADSLAYWLKDQQFRLLTRDNTYTLYARPTQAILHKAIEETATLIEKELKLCDELARKKPLAYSATFPLKEYRWIIDPLLIRDIRPEGNAYEYIQGAFRPNTAKLLELLGGHQLYGNAICALRELLQNGFDAVKERTAWQIINNELDPATQRSRLGELYTIDISLVERADGFWLVCKDRGVGMTKSIIENYFLQSGASRRHEIRELERECRKRGFHLGRTGQFGIGALCYFMLAEKIVIRTKRELNTGYRDDESIAWRFEINGMHDFGELVREQSGITGTQVEFKLNAVVVGSIADWDLRFYNFLKEEIMETPCLLSYASYSGATLNLPVGWVKGLPALREMVLHAAQDTIVNTYAKSSFPSRLPATGRKKKMDTAFVQEVMSELAESLRFLTGEGMIGDQVRYKICIPYFMLKKGNALCFLKERLEGEEHYICNLWPGLADSYFWPAKFRSIFLGLKGIRIENGGLVASSEQIYFAHVELNFEHIEEGQLQVSRREMKLDEDFSDQLEEAVNSAVLNLPRKNAHLFDNCYALLNCSIAEIPPREYFWAFRKQRGRRSQEMCWKKIEYPAICCNDFRNNRSVSGVLDGQIVPVIHSELEPPSHQIYSGRNSVNWTDSLKFEFELALQEGKPYDPIGVIKKLPVYRADHEFDDIALPPQWSGLLLIHVAHMTCLNRNHALFPYYEPETYRRFLHAGRELFLPNLESKQECAAFLIHAANWRLDKWQENCEKEPFLIKEIFAVLNVKELLLLSDDELTVFSFGQHYTVMGKQIARHLPRLPEGSYISAKYL